MFNFRQGTNSSRANPFWNLIGRFLHEPSAAQIACQHPKPILLDTGEMTFPATWTANVVPIQLFALGKQLVIIGAPAGKKYCKHKMFFFFFCSMTLFL
jgi:neutral ceramidase